MDSIDKLRTAARNMAKGRNLENHEECNLLLVIADEIETEMERDYMRLPELDDGVIKVGDWIESDYDEFKCVRKVEALIWDGFRWDFQLSDEDGDTRDCASLGDFYECSKHVAKPDPLSELLLEMLDRHTDGIGLREHGGDINSFAGKYAELIRELMEAD